MKKLEEFKITERIKKKILIGLMEQDYYGISCIFIPLTSDVGVKLYPRKYDRDYSLKWQKRLYRDDLTPKVGNPFIFVFEWPAYKDGLIFKELKLFGFFTQRANTDFENKGLMVKKLRKIASDKGFFWGDSHLGNIGMIGKKLVIIDTDPCSIGID